MGTEIERKFLVQLDSWRKEVVAESYLCQGYMSLQGDLHRTIRIRIAGEKAFLTLKGPNDGISRMEFEYPIPPEDARILLRDFCEGAVIEKIRHIVPCPNGRKWEIDEFQGDNAGLILAEIELTSEEETFPRPEWLGEEVSGDKAYYNSNLRLNPYKNWKKQ